MGTNISESEAHRSTVVAADNPGSSLAPVLSLLVLHACSPGGDAGSGAGAVVVMPAADDAPDSADAPPPTMTRSASTTAADLGAVFEVGDAGAVATEPNPQLQSDVNVIITADNAYGFGYGSGTNLVNYFGGVENISSGDIFDCPVGNGPEQYVVPAADGNAGSFLYVIGYADRSTTQGVIGKFFREGAQPIFTGNGNWEVCATGVDFDPGSGGPSLEEINQQLVVCNDGTGSVDDTSAGWVGTEASESGRLAFGEDNSTERGAPEPGNEFPIACEIDPEARWMWYDWLPERDTGSPFLWPGGSGNVTRDFLIFRLGAEFVPTVVR